MRSLKLVKILGVAIVLSGMAMSTAVAKDGAFVNKVGCYAAMKVKCNGGKCSDDEFNQSIDWCDETFANSEEPGQPATLKAKANGVLKLLLKR